MIKGHNLSWLLIVFAAILWGTDGVLITPRYFQEGFYDTKYIVFIAHFIPMIVLSIVHWKQFLLIKKFNKSDFLYYFLISLFGGVIGTFGIVNALMLSQFSKVSIVILIQQTQPIFAIIMAYILLKEKPKKEFYIFAIISIISLYFLTFGLNNPKLLPENNIKASIYSLIAAISFGSATVFSKKSLSNHSFLTSSFYRFLFTTIIMLIIMLFSGSFINSTINFVANKNLILIAFLVTIIGMSSTLLYYRGLMNTNAIFSTISELAFPLTSAILEAIVFSRYLSNVQYLAAIVLILSILYINLFIVRNE